MENVKTKTFYLIQGNDKDFLSTLYKNSVSDTSIVDDAMKFEDLEECKIINKLAKARSTNFTKSRILVIETRTYFLEQEEIPVVEI